MGIVRFALRWPYTFYVLALLILFLGVTAFRSMPADIFPEIDIPVVTVIWQYTGLSTPEMEQRVTTYSEYAMSTSVNGVKDMEAQTLDGISVQKIYFEGVGDRPNCQNRPWDKRVRSAERGRPALRASAGSTAVARGVSDYYDEKHTPTGISLRGVAAAWACCALVAI